MYWTVYKKRVIPEIFHTQIIMLLLLKIIKLLKIYLLLTIKLLIFIKFIIKTND